MDTIVAGPTKPILPVPTNYFVDCWGASVLANTQPPSEVPSDAVLLLHSYIINILVPEVAGFTIYAMIFGKVVISQPALSFAHQTPKCLLL